jgi:LacI family kdg operon repressor
MEVMKGVRTTNSKTTIDQVAKAAGVSTTTISRYLNKKYDSMSSNTRERIQKVIEELDYRPSNIARSLKSQKSGTIGCIIADITSPFSSYVVKGLMMYVVKADIRYCFLIQIVIRKGKSNV